MLHVPPEAFQLKHAFAKIECEPSWKWQKRDQPMANFDLFYVWGGQGEVVLNLQPYPVSEGSCFLFRPGDYTSATHQPQKPLVITYIHFSVNEEPGQVPQSFRMIKETQIFESLLTRYVRLFLTETFAAREEAQLILKQLMIVLLREEQFDTDPEEEKISYRMTENIHEIANYVRQNPAFPHRLETLASRARLSPRYFSAKFKEMIGQSVQSYIVRCRIERAEHLLHYAGMSVTEVADALGYRDVFFFSRQFKQYTGGNPSELR